ncbi:hypothetical protein SIAM614_00205 [Stappia aggregata IAM 12614]|uniref:Autotransporter domain-containing protein n=1 Tax=Roseibium aggregatum (strain ATCC 25650 / DSM 13394 / JCM 20685 / NBRC 16684 / NCIMB 2208 / IAM 12614 / B1) TaxID=384765 RepID=A0P3Y7_ROSAI|nr:hypothetical protein SIAM614_00205 [Stappia aggregata IAM 12614] [Roseibium aggregatum IAM 12614]
MVFSGGATTTTHAANLVIDGSSQTENGSVTVDQVIVGDTKKDSELTIEPGGQVHSTGDVTIGNKNVITCDDKGNNCSASQSSGVVNVSGEGAQLSADGDLIVGKTGKGVLNVTNGGAVQVNGDVVLGAATSAFCEGRQCFRFFGAGAAEISGEGSSLSSSGAIVVGDQGTGTLSVSDNGRVEADELVVGQQSVLASGGNAVSVSSGGVVSTETVSVKNGSLSVREDGRVETSDLVVRGAGSVDVSADGLVTSDTFRVIGGDLSVSEGGAVETGTLALRQGAAADVSSGGAITAETVSLANSSLTVGQDGSLAAGGLALERGASADVSSGGAVTAGTVSLANSSLTVGQEGTVETDALSLEQGSTADVSSGGAVTAGTVSLANSSLTVGQEGTVETDALSLEQGATADVSSGGAVTAGTVSLANSSLTVGQDGGLDTIEVLAEQGGTITISNGGEIRSETVTLQTSATLTIGASSGEEASGAGALQGLDDDPVSIVFGDGGGSIVLNHTEDDYRLEATVSGDGVLSQEAGYTSLTGNFSDFSGTGSVKGGTLSIDTAYGGSVDVEAGGTLTGTGTVGDVDFKDGSTYLVTVDGGDVLDSTGVVTIEEGASVELGVDADFQISLSDSTIILSGTEVIGEFSSLDGEAVTEVNENHLFVDLALVYDPTSVSLSGERNDTAFADLSTTFNQRATSGGLETLSPGNEVYETFATLQVAEAGDVPAILDQLSGEIHATVQSQELRNSFHVRDLIRERTHGLFDDDRTDGSAQVSTNGPGDSHLEVAPGGSIWAQGYGSFAQVDGDGNAARFDASTGGGFAGVEGYTVHGLLVGVVAGFGRTDVTVAERTSSANIESFTVGSYLSGGFGPVKLHVGSALTRNQIGSSRSVAFSGFTDTLEADYASHTAQAFGEIGYSVETAYANFVPFAGFSVTHMRTQGFSEKGGDAALESEASDQTLVSTTLGLRMERTFESLLGEGKDLSFNGFAAWRHRFGDTTQYVTSAFDGSQPFTIASAPIDDNTLLVEVGATLKLNGRADVSGTYRGEFGGSAHENNFGARLNLSF